MTRRSLRDRNRAAIALDPDTPDLEPTAEPRSDGVSTFTVEPTERPMREASSLPSRMPGSMMGIVTAMRRPLGRRYSVMPSTVTCCLGTTGVPAATASATRDVISMG